MFRTMIGPLLDSVIPKVTPLMRIDLIYQHMLAI